MEFKGWVTDSLPAESESYSWRDAYNILITKGFKSVSNESGFNKIQNLGNDEYLIGVIPLPRGFVVFKNSNGFLEIGTYLNNTYIIKLRTAFLDADVNFPIEGVFKYNYKSDLIIAWTNNKTDVGLLNLDDLPFTLDANKELVNSSEIVKAYLFPHYKHPNFPTIEEYDSGGLLPEGVIQVVVRYNISGFDCTRCSLPSNPIIVKQITHYYPPGQGVFEVSTGRTVARTYNAGLISASFKVSLTELDTRYRSFEVILISRTVDNISAKIYQSYDMPISGSRDIMITSFTGEDIPVAEVTVPRFTFKTCKTLTVINNRLVPANIKFSNTIDYQKYANNIKVKWETENLASSLGAGYDPLNNGKYSYSSSKVSFLFRGYQPNEVVCLYIHLVLTDGTITDGYNIPGRKATGNDTQVVSLANGYLQSEVDIDPDGSSTGIFKRFHIKDTSTVVTPSVTGGMGFWENSDEVYPNTLDYEVWDATGKIDDIQGENVRHHRIPDSETLNETTPLNQVYLKVVSLSFEDIYIPPDIESQISGFFITYAKRLSGKTLVEGESKLLAGDRSPSGPSQWYFNAAPRSVDALRFYDYNLLLNKPSLYPRYIKNLGYIECVTPTSVGFVAQLKVKPTDANRFQVLDNTRYYPVDNSIVRNYHKEECVGLELKLETTAPLAQLANNPAFNPAVDVNGYHNGIKGYTVQLLNHTYNIYNNVTNQELMFTGKIIKTDGSNDYSISKLYGGDTFLTLQKFRTAHLAGVDDTDTANNLKFYFDHHTAVYSPMNYTLFFGQETKDNYEYENPTGSTYTIVDSSDTTGASDIKFRPLFYNRTFSSINSIIGMFPYNTYNIFVDRNPYIVYRSVEFQTESKALNWRDFLANDYYEMPRERGEVWKVATYNKTLIIHQQYSLFTASIKDKLSTLDGNTYLGVGDIFDRPPDEQLTSDKGTCGTQSQFASFVCDFGYFSVDLQEGKVFLFNGSAMELSNKKIRNQLRERFAIALNLDNPFIIGGATACYDDKNKRLVLNVGNLVDYITVSYAFDSQMWICRHQYDPNYLFHNRDNCYAVSNGIGRGIYSFNAINKATYFNGVVAESSIDFLFKVEDAQQLIESISWNSLVSSSNNVIQKKTFDKIQVYNNLQATPLTDITDNSSIWFKGNSRELDEVWNFNKIRDCVINRTVKVHDNRGVVNNGNVNSSSLWFKKSNIIANFVVVKLVYTNQNQADIYLNDIQVNANSKNR